MRDMQVTVSKSVPEQSGGMADNMDVVDVNCLLGHWPFRKIYKDSFEDLKKVHSDNGITGGYVSSINSIFYNDPYEGDIELHEIIKCTQYHHVLTVNPTLPCFSEDIENGVREFDIKGVRIYPGYHQYGLDCDKLKQLCNVLEKFHLPLFLTLRMEDNRITYLIQPQTPDIENVKSFIKSHTNIKILLLNIHFAEIIRIKDCINSMPNIFIDTSGLKGPVFNVEELMTEIDENKIIYGSLHPLNCLKSTFLQIAKAEIEQRSIEKIFSLNSQL